MELKEIRSERVPDGTQMNHVDCDTEKAVTDVYVEDKRTRQSLLSNCQPNGLEKATAEPENEGNVTDKTPNCVARGIDKVSQSVNAFYSRHKRTISLTVRCVFVALWVAYLVYAAYLNGQRALVVIIITAIVFFFVSYEFLQRHYGDVIYDVICRLLAGVKCGKRVWKYTHWTFYALLLVGLTVFLVLDTGRNPENFRSAGGLTLLLLLTFVTSKYPAKIRWRPVLWGLAFQFLMGLMVLRWSAGFALFQFLGAQVQTFAGFVDAGSKMVFGDPGYKMHPVAFQILPIIIFYSAVINVLYYYGAIQWMVRKMAWLMQVTMKITPIEALHTAASIFLGQVETGVMFRPFWQRLTQSELCACMTGGFTTIAGTVIAAFIAFGASPEHLISASIMSAPAAMAIAKLGFPETETSHTKTEEDVQMAPPYVI
ncbi:solute carrier family 28 member 3-like [Lingula anatina]|uniref:Solute carrier family 28 member 3-like n=1 Tax=Lingula anatina TaxID=7574 RepID=A0A1S3JYQ3_LINAN|nr:solute carrier family 28 member 3-like [Lingula anatina]|eukprot:XP_013415422.1 solute carrier family 28 member 3-like [Lingula anatina]